MQIGSRYIHEILAKIQSNVYVIPQFQRNFIWDPAQVKRLVDSVARNYPIGSLLTLNRGQEMTLHSRTINALIKEEYDEVENSKKQIEYILDGQQRLTSIARVFLNADPKRTYYFDLKKMYEEFDCDEDNHSWIVSRRRSKIDPKRKEDNKLIRADIILDKENANTFVSEYFDESIDFPQFLGRENGAARRKVISKIQGIFEVIRNYQIPVVVLDSDSPLESVCRIFETINSTGTKLTTFDLAVAKFFPNPDLPKIWSASKEEFPILDKFEVDGERVLQVLALWEAKTDQHRNPNFFPEVTRSRLLKIKKTFINENWHMAIQALADVYEWVRNHGATPTTLSNHAILVAIAASNIVNKPFLSPIFSNTTAILQRWYFNKVMPPVKFTATNYRISEDFNTLCNFFEHGTPLDFKEVKLTKEVLKSINRPQDNRYKAVQCIIAMSAKKDFISGDVLYVDELEYHHIFPRSLGTGKSKSYRELLESLMNRVPISKKSNRLLSDKRPVEYFGELKRNAIKDGTVGETKKRLADCFLPSNIESVDFVSQFENSNFDNFLEGRAKLILTRVREILGDSLSESETVLNADDMDDEV